MRFSLVFVLALAAAAPVLANAPATVDGPVTASHDHTEAWREFLTAQRTQALTHLVTYAEARVYPINDVQVGAVSMLRDANGSPCAMAYLVEQTGHASLIDALVPEANDTRFEDQVAGTALHEWTLTSGLLLEEAAMVQEPDFYMGEWFDGIELPSIAAMENQRLYSHFNATTQILALQSQPAIEVALTRLGDRLNQAPPAPVVASL